MLEAGIHQAAGLCAQAEQQAPRIVAVASHGDRRSELPLLWQLCTAWTALGYPVVVIDATVMETRKTPGLHQILLDNDELSRFGHGVETWPIVPAAQGLADLCRPERRNDSATRVRLLSELFHNYELVLLYAPAGELAAGLHGSGVSPLLPVSADEAALLTAYHALKQMLNNGKLRPTIVAVMDDSALATRVSGLSIGRNLQDCARDFLACEVPALALCPNQTEDVRQLALRTLESALQTPRWNPSSADPSLAAVRNH